ncbi:unnamed protein product, partial [Hapterophycus canaliculatus]
ACRLLGVQRRYTCEEIAESVGGRRVGTMAATELKRYKERFLASYPAKQVASIDLDGTVYAVSAFYLCAKKLKHPVDKQRLLDLSLVREAEFTAVCRSMLELCYGTLGVSLGDKPSAERLAQFSKATALGNNDTDRPSSAAGSARVTASGVATSTPLVRNGGGDGRRTIPLSGGRGGLGAPRSHMAALARSIQAATQRKRSGGTTVALAEPGGSNEANNTLHDRTHHPAVAKRPRRPIPTAAGSTSIVREANVHRSSVVASAAASSTGSIAGASDPPAKAPRVAVKNPYATAAGAAGAAAAAGASPAVAGTPAIGSTKTGESSSSSSSSRDRSSGAAAQPPSSAPETPRAAIRNPYAPNNAAAETAPVGSTAAGKSKTSGGGEEKVRKAQEYAAWKERVLISMENKMGDDERQDNVGAVTSHSSPAPATTGAPAGAGASAGAAGTSGLSVGISTAGTTRPAAPTVVA